MAAQFSGKARHSAAILLTMMLTLFALPAFAAGPDEDDNKYTHGLGKDFNNKVAAAITKGADWLKSKQDPKTGSWGEYGKNAQYEVGPTALAAYTLLKAGEDPNSECIEKAFAFMREQKIEKTYEAGIMLMAIMARYYSLESGKKNSKNNTIEKPMGPKACAKMPAVDRKWMERCFNFIVDNKVIGTALIKDGGGGRGGAPADGPVTGNVKTVGWRYPGNGVDHSNTQYAVLGLWAALHCGYEADPNLWRGLLEYFLEVQEEKGPAVTLKREELEKAKPVGDDAASAKSGSTLVVEEEIKAHARGWGYQADLGKRGAYGSMTTAGIACVVIARDELLRQSKSKNKNFLTKELYEKANQSAVDGIAWLAENFSVDENPVLGAGWHRYYLYGLERACVLGGFVHLGDNHWYKEGAEHLIGAQRKDGCWLQGGQNPPANGAVVETCFAILFLKRSTTSLLSGPVTQ